MRSKAYPKLLLVFALLIAAAVFLGFPRKTGQEETKQNNVDTSPSVSEYPPLKMCKQTGGSWEKVPATENPADENAGVFSPTADRENNFRCFCPDGKSWAAGSGCA